MYIPSIDGVTKEAVKAGDVGVLRDILIKADKNIIEKLKFDKNETRFHQGASHIVDTLLELLK